MRHQAQPNIVIYKLIICLSVFLFLLADNAPAEATNDNPQFAALQKKLIKDGFSPEKIQELYRRPQVIFEAKGVTLLFTYREGKLNYGQFTNDRTIRRAQKYLETHAQDLKRVETAYGVDSRVITAILLVETNLGTTIGSRSAFNTLSTLSALMDPDVRSKFYEKVSKDRKISRKKFEKKANRRSKWAYKELKALLQYADREDLDPLDIPGSFAGAVGYPQFMPTNIIAYGQDGNNDGRISMVNHADSMASIANYLKSHGWRPGISSKKAEKVIYSYNHSKYYVKTILKISTLLKS